MVIKRFILLFLLVFSLSAFAQGGGDKVGNGTGDVYIMYQINSMTNHEIIRCNVRDMSIEQACKYISRIYEFNLTDKEDLFKEVCCGWY